MRAPLAIVMLVLVLCGTAPALSQTGNDSGGAVRADPQPADESFAKTAAVSGLFEIDASRLALTRSSDAAIKQFAQMMIDDHTAAGDELRRVAGVMELPDALDPPHRDLVTALENSGGNFDRVYVEQQVEAHRQAVALFTQFSTTGPNGAFRGFAAKTLPVLQHHQEMAGQLVDKVK